VLETKQEAEVKINKAEAGRRILGSSCSSSYKVSYQSPHVSLGQVEKQSVQVLVLVVCLVASVTSSSVRVEYDVQVCTLVMSKLGFTRD
jgi:predicted DNA repair protein MutK